MKSYTTYIFDLDGTITDTMAVWLAIYRDVLVECGITPPDDKTLSKYTHDWHELVALGLPKDQVDHFAELAYAQANKRLPDAPLHVGAYDMLETLKNRGKQIAIFSTMDRQIFEPAVNHRNLRAITEILIAGSDVSHRKPRPDGILKALSDLNTKPEDYKTAVYIGDKDTDIQAATNAGIDGVLYYPASHQLIYDRKELEQHKPTSIITDWQELVDSLD